MLKFIKFIIYAGFGERAACALLRSTFRNFGNEEQTRLILAKMRGFLIIISMSCECNLLVTHLIVIGWLLQHMRLVAQQRINESAL